MNKKTILFPLSTLVLLIISLQGIGQLQLVHYDSVSVVEEQTLTNAWAGGLNCPQFSEMDLNNDGVKDLVVFERNFYGAVRTFLNNGTPGQVDYIYAPEYQVRFPQLRNWMLLRDYNCDGKEDIFTSVPAGVAVYRNDSDPVSGIHFTKVTSLLQTIGLYGQTPLYVSPPDVPAIVDIDNDGDLDILSFNILGSTVEYHKNFSMENYGNCNQLDFELKNACWGYFSEDGNNNTVTLNDTCDENVIDPEKVNLHAGSTILALDMNGNGVKDIVLGDLTFNNMVMLTNGGTVTSSGITAFDTTFPSNSTPVNLTVFPAGYHLDADNDGLKDLLVAPNNPNTSENHNNIWFYKNEGTQDVPEFDYQQNDFLQEEMIDVGERSFPVFFDENSDGLMDILVGGFGYYVSTGNYSSRLMLLRNTGSLESPSFELITGDYAGLGELGFEGIYPTFGDMDNDGDLDMLTGDEEGNLHLFRNDADVGQPADFTLSQPNYKGIQIGLSAKPQIIDVNRDGLPDILVGERSGTIKYFQNIGIPENADFDAEPTNDLFGNIDVMPECCTGYSAPCMVEDSVGNYLLYVGSEQGKLYMFNEIENNLDGTFSPVDSLYLQGVNINASGYDINLDGKTEFVFGEFSGGIGLLKYGTPEVLGINPSSIQPLSVELYPNPSNGSLHVKIQEQFPDQEIQLQVLNVFGQVVKNTIYSNSKGTFHINTSSLEPGVYFVNTRVGKHSDTKKFIQQ